MRGVRLVWSYLKERYSHPKDTQKSETYNRHMAEHRNTRECLWLEKPEMHKDVVIRTLNCSD